MVRYKKGHRNSKGEKAEWCIVSHETGKVISSHKSRSAAEKHLGEIQMFKHMKNESMNSNMNMSFEQAIDILASEPIVLESKIPRTAEEWKKISEIWLKKRDEQVKLLHDNPQWIGRPAELSTKKLIAKYDGYYEQALKKAQELEYYEEEYSEQLRQEELAQEELMKNYDFDRGDWRY